MPPLVWWSIGLIVALIVTGFLLWQVKRAIDAMVRRLAKAPANAPGNGADVLTYLAASIATIVSAQGMWQFVGRIIGDVHWSLRGLMFAFIEVAVVTSAVRARRNMRDNFSAGIDGAAVWALTGLSAVLSALEAASIPEALFRLAAPLVAAWLWERGMAIERRRIRGRSSIHWRLTPERVMVRLGLAESSERTASEVDAQRRLTRVALAAKKARTLREAGVSARKQVKAIAAMERAYAAAHAHTGLGRDETVQKALAGEVGSLFSAAGLLDVAPASAWTPASSAPSEAVELAAELRRWTDAEQAKRDPEFLAAMASMAAAATGRHLWPVTSGVTPPVTRRDVIPDVTNTVTERVNDTTLSVPPGWSGDTPVMTAAMTPAEVIPGISSGVTFDVTDPAVFDLTWPPPEPPMLTSTLTPAVTPPVVSPPVTMESKAEVMRAFWERERAQSRYPRVVDLAREAGADTGQASRLRAELVEALPWRERRKATPRREKTSA